MAFNWDVITPIGEASETERRLVQAILEAASDRLQKIAEDNNARATFFVADPGTKLHDALKIKLPKSKD